MLSLPTPGITVQNLERLKTEEWSACLLSLLAPGITVQNLERMQNEEQAYILNRKPGRKRAAVLEAVVSWFEPHNLFYSNHSIIYKIW